VISAFRLSTARFSANSGVGAALYGGRWNAVGTEAIYAAESTSLAVLEVLVHFSVLPADFVMTEIRIPETVSILRVNEDELPLGWDREIPIAATQELGTRWVREGRSAVLSVPSSIVAPERNFVFNSAHPSFLLLKFLAPVPFGFDSRLK
jgi:RES domain-containing protein